MEASRKATAAALSILDAHLASRAFVTGDRFTMGDIPIGCGVWRWMALPIERPPLGNLQRWFDGLVQRPAFSELIMTPLT
jgi:glutathione S-transferase